VGARLNFRLDHIKGKGEKPVTPFFFCAHFFCAQKTKQKEETVRSLDLTTSKGRDNKKTKETSG